MKSIKMKNDTPARGLVAERYSKGWVEIHVHVLTWNARKFCALFYPSKVRHQPVRDGSPNLNVTWMSQGSPVERVDQIEVPMLIDNVQIVESPEEQTAWASLKWLLPLESCVNLWGDRFRDSLNSPRGREPTSMPEDRELGSFVGRVGRDQHQGPHQMVESGAIAEECIADDWAQLGWRFLGRPVKPIDFLASLSVDINADAVELTIAKGFNLCLQTLEVSVRPIYLHPRAFEKRMHDLYWFHERQKDSKDTEGTRNPHPHKGRFSEEPGKGGEAEEISHSPPSEVTSRTAHDHSGGYTARRTHSSTPEGT